MRVALAPIALAGLALTGCGLEERPDFLIGRACAAETPSCDPGQSCLPHQWTREGPADFRCRDEASFARLDSNREPPLAYCEEGSFECPGDLVCAPDRIRAFDGGFWREVCQLAVSTDGSTP